MNIIATETRRLRLPLAGPTGGSGLTAVDVVLVRLTDRDAETGLGISYALGRIGADAMTVAAKELCDAAIERRDLPTPEAAFADMTGLLNRLGKGVHVLAIAAIDMPLWDLYAKQLGRSVGVAMGGQPRRVPVYGSGGFRPGMDPAAAVERAAAYAERGCGAVKLRLTGTSSDARFLEAVRNGLPDEIRIMVDVNEKGSLEQALWLADVCAAHGVLWIEEPLRARDFEGYRQLAERSSIAIAAGEHLQGRDEFHHFVASRSLAVAQPDHAMMGGLTECLRTARFCEAFGVTVAPHFLPSLFVHLAAAAGNLAWLEDFPLLEPLFVDPPAFDADGCMSAPAAPGHGLVLDPDALERYAV